MGEIGDTHGSEIGEIGDTHRKSKKEIERKSRTPIFHGTAFDTYWVSFINLYQLPDLWVSCIKGIMLE